MVFSSELRTQFSLIKSLSLSSSFLTLPLEERERLVRPCKQRLRSGGTGRSSSDRRRRGRVTICCRVCIVCVPFRCCRRYRCRSRRCCVEREIAIAIAIAISAFEALGVRCCGRRWRRWLALVLLLLLLLLALGSVHTVLFL